MNMEKAAGRIARNLSQTPAGAEPFGIADVTAIIGIILDVIEKCRARNRDAGELRASLRSPGLLGRLVVRRAAAKRLRLSGDVERTSRVVDAFFEAGRDLTKAELEQVIADSSRTA